MVYETSKIKHYSCTDSTCNAKLKVIFEGKSEPCICPRCGADLVEISATDFDSVETEIIVDKLFD